MDEKRRSNTFWVYRAGELGTVLGLEVGADRTSQAYRRVCSSLAVVAEAVTKGITHSTLPRNP